MVDTTHTAVEPHGEETRTAPEPSTLDERLPLAGPDGQLLDLLGARLHFEQTGVQLYDALLARLDSEAELAAGPTRGELIEIRDDERQHVRMIAELITDLGGDPALVTPAASREAIAIHGIGAVIRDQASTLLDALEAIVIVELADHEQWVGLVELARELSRDDLARSFLTAQTIEHKHLSKMRAWISAGRAASRNVGVP